VWERLTGWGKEQKSQGEGVKEWVGGRVGGDGCGSSRGTGGGPGCGWGGVGPGEGWVELAVRVVVVTRSATRSHAGHPPRTARRFKQYSATLQQVRCTSLLPIQTHVAGREGRPPAGAGAPTRTTDPGPPYPAQLYDLACARLVARPCKGRCASPTQTQVRVRSSCASPPRIRNNNVHVRLHVRAASRAQVWSLDALSSSQGEAYYWSGKHLYIKMADPGAAVGGLAVGGLSLGSWRPRVPRLGTHPQVSTCPHRPA
jgi:hypothetical protein